MPNRNFDVERHYYHRLETIPKHIRDDADFILVQEEPENPEDPPSSIFKVVKQPEGFNYNKMRSPHGFSGYLQGYKILYTNVHRTPVRYNTVGQSGMYRMGVDDERSYVLEYKGITAWNFADYGDHDPAEDHSELGWNVTKENVWRIEDGQLVTEEDYPDPLEEYAIAYPVVDDVKGDYVSALSKIDFTAEPEEGFVSPVVLSMSETFEVFSEGYGVFSAINLGDSALEMLMLSKGSLVGGIGGIGLVFLPPEDYPDPAYIMIRVFREIGEDYIKFGGQILDGNTGELLSPKEEEHVSEGEYEDGYGVMTFSLDHEDIDEGDIEAMRDSVIHGIMCGEEIVQKYNYFSLAVDEEAPKPE